MAELFQFYAEMFVVQMIYILMVEKITESRGTKNCFLLLGVFVFNSIYGSDGNIAVFTWLILSLLKDNHLRYSSNRFVNIKDLNNRISELP